MSESDPREFGRAVRSQVPRSSIGAWAPAKRDPLETIAASCDDRLPRLLPIRWGRMRLSPFAFFRGTAGVMARDLASRPHTPLIVQLCGDAHVRNLGAYATPEGHLVFDINDFDETIQGPFEWDILRFATSLQLVAEEAKAPEQSRRAVLAFVESYRRSVHHFAAMPFVDLLRSEIRRMISREPVHRILRKAERATPPRLLAKLAERTRRGWRFRHAPPLLARVPRAVSTLVLNSISEYESTLSCEHAHALMRYRVADVAFKIVGTGSVGTRDYVMLWQGAMDDDVLFLQIKQEPPSCYAPYLGQQVAHDGRRVAEGQRLMQRASDPFLGWSTIDGRAFVVRQLSDHKATIDPEELRGRPLVEYARVAGAVFARAHARTGPAAAIAAYLGIKPRFDNAAADFAANYSGQVKRDYRLFKAAIRSRRLRAITS